MPALFPDGPAWAALAQAVGPGLKLAETVLQQPILDGVELVEGAPGGPLWAWQGNGRLALDPALLGPDLHIALDAELLAGPAAPLALDRFRRATGALIEAACAGAQGEGWRAIAAAADTVDRALPALGWLGPEAAGLLLWPERSLLDAPRRGAFYLRWSALTGCNPDPDAEAWAAFGLWCRDRQAGPSSRYSVDIPMAEPQDASLPWQAAALSHRPLQLQPPPAGWRLSLREGAALAPAVVLTPAVGVVGVVTAGAVAVHSQPAGPVGRWRVASGSFGGQVGAARGVELQLQVDGVATLTGADAFLGPPTRELLELADRYGVSGSTRGRWHLVAADPAGSSGRLRLSGLVATGATVHPRAGHAFAFPAQKWLQPVQAVLDALSSQDLRWTREDGNLTLQAEVFGLPIVLRLSV